MSNCDTWAETMAPINAANKERVFQATWGHLAPTKNRTYKGKILFCKSEYNSGSITLISTDFPELDSSPWFYDAIHDFLYNWEGLKEGTVYQIDATFRNYRWWGIPKPIYSLLNN